MKARRTWVGGMQTDLKEWRIVIITSIKSIIVLVDRFVQKIVKQANIIT